MKFSGTPLVKKYRVASARSEAKVEEESAKDATGGDEEWIPGQLLNHDELGGISSIGE